MPRIFIHMSFVLFTITALSGLWMRISSIYPNQIAPYTNILHAHSHTAILGWAFLGVLSVMLALFWTRIKRRKQAIALISSLFIVSLVMFFAFMSQGYDVFSIITSTLHIFLEYWGAIFIYRELSNLPYISRQGKLYVFGSLFALIVSSIGPFSLGFIAANGLRDSGLFDMAIYFYLHFQYNGWLFLMLIGLFIFILQRNHISHSPILLNIGFWIYMICLFPGYFLSVLWVDLGPVAEGLAIAGGIGQWVGVLCILVAFKEIWNHLSMLYNWMIVTGLMIVFALLFLKSTMELGLIIPDMAGLIYNTRNVIIGYLHFTLLGFVSIFIMVQLQLTGIIDPSKHVFQIGFGMFIIGLLWNEILLFYNGATNWFVLPSLPAFPESLVGASLLLLIGILFIWRATAEKN
ncbi:MAG TPA: hypothetical protein VK111_08605 [Virgibacillus sp.]|nr:hypothetical protein [Virgibacillus sp.]